MLARTWVRIALSYAALVLGTAGVLGILLGDEASAREEAGLRARLRDQAAAVAWAAGPLLASGAPITETEGIARTLAATFGTRVTLIRADGVVVGDSEEDPRAMENHQMRPEVAAVLADPGAVGSSTRTSATVHRPLLYVAVAVRDSGRQARMVGVARVAYSLQSVEAAQAALWSKLGLAVLLVSLPAALLGVLLGRSIVGPLSTLRLAAERLGGGALGTRAVTGPGEIGDLGRAFNAMAAQLSGTIADRTAERNQMAAVLAQMHDGIVLTDRDGLVTGLNPAGTRLLGVTAGRAAGRSLVDLSHSHELHRALREALAAPGERRHLEFSLAASRMAAVVTAVPGPGDAPPTGLVVLQDVTELRRLERVRRDFVANIGHELRTPLASIKLLVQTVQGALGDDPEAATGFLGRIDLEVDSLTQLVRELLELSRIESGQVTLARAPVGVEGLLQQAAVRLQAQAERAGLALTVGVAPGLPEVDVDTARIEQVLLNLLQNAIKFTPPGGRVALTAQAAGEAVQVRVADTGVGIPPEDQPRIFERFYKVDKARAGGAAREGGTGLGLAIAKHLVQAHGGEIWLESEPGAGTTVAFTLPAAAIALAWISRHESPLSSPRNLS